MSIENKFTLKFLKSLFTQLNKEWGDQKKITTLENDPWDFEQFLGVLEKIYGFTDQDEKDWIYGAFLENWKNLTGDFEDLTEENFIIPQLKHFETEETEWWDTQITKTYKSSHYTRAILKSDIYNGFLDPDNEYDELIERTDSEIQIKEVKPEELKKDEKN